MMFMARFKCTYKAYCSLTVSENSKKYAPATVLGKFHACRFFYSKADFAIANGLYVEPDNHDPNNVGL